jgi:phage repressor protein C with HTH and peptisase S24 domain
MGGGLDLADDVVVDEVQLNPRWIQSKLPQVSDPRKLTFITGYGDSMEETFFHGDVLFVDRGVSEIKVDAVYVFELERELFIKRLQRLPGGAVKVISDNRKYESYVVDGGKPSKKDMHILGRVVGAWNWRPL